jgi:glutaredoxin
MLPISLVMPEEKKYFLLTVEGCFGCEEVEKQLKELGVKHEVRDVGVDREAALFALKLDVNAVPQVVSREDIGDSFKLCSYDDELREEKCVIVSKEEYEKLLREG